MRACPDAAGTVDVIRYKSSEEEKEANMGAPHSNDSAGSGRPVGGPGRVNFDEAPFLVIWETTQACDLACRHCRADAVPQRHPDELTTAEGRALIDEVRRFGRPLFVLTGGDPLKRPDIFELIAYARDAGLAPGLSPSATPLLTRAALEQARDAGASIVSISLDSPDAAEHDNFRGVLGSFERSLTAARDIVSLGLRLQINTVVTRRNVDDLPRMAKLVAAFGAARWEVFLLVPTGRGRTLEMAAPERLEQALAWLYDLAGTAPFHLTVVEGQHYRRIVVEHLAAAADRDPAEVLAESASGGGRYLPGMNAGKGFLFVAHDGTVYPSGFLPLGAGNVRSASLVDIYRNAPLFRGLRDPNRLEGRCGACAYHALCGGSRARAFGLTGNPFAEDPACAFQPSVGLAAPV
jgi:radical SAM protein